MSDRSRYCVGMEVEMRGPHFADPQEALASGEAVVAAARELGWEIVRPRTVRIIEVEDLDV